MNFRLFARFILVLIFFLSSNIHAQQKVNNTAATINERIHQVPVLCYHQIRDWTNSDSKSSRVYITPINAFKDQMQALQKAGYHSISPDQLLAYVLKGSALPAKPILLTFDDGTLSQYETALPELQKARFTATFFIMTVTINRPRYMSRDMIKTLVSKGYTIGCHTWNHQPVTKYTAADWEKQLAQPTKELQEITGKRMIYFAYPDGLYNNKAFQPLKNAGYIAAFQLWGRSDETQPLLCIKRMIVDSHWTGSMLVKEINAKYHQ
ncbi:MAG: polysaccharide deacetylase family protein [Flavipsychrobacter sp.]